MYDTSLQLADVPRRKEARSTAAPFAASGFADFSCSEVFFVSETPASNDMNLGQAVESKKRDNAALGETLMRIGLLEPRELSAIRSSQAAASDLVGSLMIASAIRTRLGEILLREKRITSSQLEHALELQRHKGGETIMEDTDVLRRNDTESVDAWMRAAAYAAGDDPDLVLSPTGSAQAELDFAS